MKYRILFPVILISLFVISMIVNEACNTRDIPQRITIDGKALIQLPLPENIAEKDSELSGLTWYHDELILLVQYPDRFKEAGISAVFSISKPDILNAINDKHPDILSVRRINLYDQEVVDNVPGFQGYEGVIIEENRVVLLIESNMKGQMGAYLVEGLISEKPDNIHLDVTSLKEIPLPAQIKNISYETLIGVDDKIVVVFEANGRNVNDNPFAVVYDPSTGVLNQMGFPVIEYRITDATEPDEKDVFWVINYYWPGEYKKLNPASYDNISSKLKFDPEIGIERLIQLKYSESGITLSGKLPIELKVGTGEESFNWEGIARLDDIGFLVVTDTYPETILAFIPYTH